MQQVYQLKINLRHATPPIWRRVIVEESTTLAYLHEIIQHSFAWTDSHMHEFEIRQKHYAPEEFELEDTEDTRTITLKQLNLSSGEQFSYGYDFGDNWEHLILVEEIKPAEAGKNYPTCSGGERAAPLDDCGGIEGFEEFIAILQDPSHPEYEERAEWYGLEEGEKFDPAYFNVQEVNDRLDDLRTMLEA